MTTHTLKVPRWRPATCNELMRRSVKTRIRLAKRDRKMVAAHALQQRLPRATRRRRVNLIVRLGPRQRECDADALWKSCLDSLASCGLIRGDRVRDVELGVVTYVRGAAGECGTVIELTDLE